MSRSRQRTKQATQQTRCAPKAGDQRDKKCNGGNSLAPNLRRKTRSRQARLALLSLFKSGWLTDWRACWIGWVYLRRLQLLSNRLFWSKREQMLKKMDRLEFALSVKLHLHYSSPTTRKRRSVVERKVSAGAQRLGD